MKKTASYFLPAFVAAIIAILPLMTPAIASAEAINMLPPYDSQGHVCTGILQWDGTAHGLTCFTQLSGDVKTGSITLGAPLILNQSNIQTNKGIVVFGDGQSTVTWQNVCNGAGTVGVDMSGNLHCCPPGKIVTVTYQNSVSCGYLN